MKVKAEVFSKLIKQANVEGLIGEVVLADDMLFASTDESSAILSIAKKSIGKTGFGKIGIYDLNLLIKAIQFAAGSIFDQNEELDISVEDNRLVFKKGDNEFKFLLSHPETISSCVENPKEALDKIRSKPGVKINLERRDMDSILKAISLTNPEVTTVVAKEGKVLCIIGKNIEHNTIIKMGEYEGDFPETSLMFNPEMLSKVLVTMGLSDLVDLEIRHDFPMVFESEDHYLIVAPLTI